MTIRHKGGGSHPNSGGSGASDMAAAGRKLSEATAIVASGLASDPVNYFSMNPSMPAIH